MLDADGHAVVDEVAHPGDKVAWRLHPPTLRALGMASKLSISTRWRPAMRLLAGARRLRGTPVDPFGRAEVRRVERALPDEYLAAVRAALGDRPAVDDLARAVTVADLADLVRGYENVKLANVERFRAEAARVIGG